MSGSGVTLAVDIGAVATVAAVARDGHRSPVVFADSLTLPTPALDSHPGMGLIKAVEVVRGEDAEPIVAALTGHLRAVADYAGECEAVTVVVPPSWGPRHHERVTRAAIAAGLPQPVVLSDAAAIAAHTFPTAGDDETVVVCVLGQHTSHATVVQRRDSAWIRVATQAIPDATGDRIDHALASAVGAPTTATDELLAHVADVRARLVAGQPTAIIIPGRPAPRTIGPADLDIAAHPIRQAVLAAILDTLDAAAVDAHQLHGAVVAGDLASTLAPADELSEHLSVKVTTAADGRLAAVYGALATQPSSSPPAAAFDRRILRRAWGVRGVHLLAPIVAAVAAGLLQWQIFDIVSYALGPEISRLQVTYGKLAVVFDTAAFACVGWCLTAACLAVARNLAAALRADASSAARERDRQAGQIYAFAAVVGLALASMQGLLAETIIGGPPELAPPYLGASLAGAIVPALIAIIIGLAAPWLTAKPAWTDRVHHPMAAVILALTGILSSNARSAGLPIPGLPDVVTAVLGITGGGLLGVGIAFTLVTARAARIILGALMGVACVIIVGFSNLHSAIVIYLIAVAVWWIRRGSRVLVDNLPPYWWRRFTVAEEPVDKSP